MTASPVLTDLQTALASAALLIAPLAAAGLALINTGLGRSRNAAHALMSALCASSVAALVYFAVAARFFAGVPAEGSPAFLTGWLGLTGVSLAALIPRERAPRGGA